MNGLAETQPTRKHVDGAIAGEAQEDAWLPLPAHLQALVWAPLWGRRDVRRSREEELQAS